jgi:hypothetical protein
VVELLKPRDMSSSKTKTTELPKSRLRRVQSHNYSRQESLKSEKSGVQIVDPGQWLLWCEENKVIGSSNSIPLDHHEVECYRRYFDSMKLSETDRGVHPQTMAESFLRAEIFPTLIDALSFAQKLRSDSESLVLYSDIIDATQCRSNYKRGKMRAYIKSVATSELSNSTSAKMSARVGANQLTSLDLGTPTSVTHSPHFSEDCDRFLSTKTVERISENNEQPSGVIDSCKEPTGSGTESSQQTSRNPVSGTLEIGRTALAQLVSNATDLIGSMFNVKPTDSLPSGDSLSLVPQNPKPLYNHQGSGESIRSFGALRRYFSRSSSRSPVASTYESKRSENVLTNNTNKLNVVSLTDVATGDGGKLPQNSKLLIRPVLKKMDSGETRIHPKVKFKRAAMKIYIANQLVHTFRAKNCRVAAGFVDSAETADATQRCQEARAFADAVGVDSKEMFAHPASKTPTASPDISL